MASDAEKRTVDDHQPMVDRAERVNETPGSWAVSLGSKKVVGR